MVFLLVYTIAEPRPNYTSSIPIPAYHLLWTDLALGIYRLLEFMVDEVRDSGLCFYEVSAVK